MVWIIPVNSETLSRSIGAVLPARGGPSYDSFVVFFVWSPICVSATLNVHMQCPCQYVFTSCQSADQLCPEVLSSVCADDLLLWMRMSCTDIKDYKAFITVFCHLSDAIRIQSKQVQFVCKGAVLPHVPSYNWACLYHISASQKDQWKCLCKNTLSLKGSWNRK